MRDNETTTQNPTPEQAFTNTLRAVGEANARYDFNTLVHAYRVASHKYETSQLGPDTDKAYRRMERLLAKADARGWTDQFIAELTK